LRAPPHRLIALALLLWLGLAACGGPLIRPRLTPTPRPTRTPLPSPDAPPTATRRPRTPTPTPPPGWETLLPGFELGRMIIVPEGFEYPVEVTVVRLDPARIDLRVHYSQATAATVSGWQARTGALLVVNGGFFYPSRETLGLLIADGETFGYSFDGHGGMLSVVGDEISIRSLAQYPYRPGERFDQAVQGRPMLLYPGGVPADFTLSRELSRRTAVALDRRGRLVFFAIDYGAVSLYDLRDWMAWSEELDLFVGFNLDGGGSTGLALDVGGRSLLIDSWTTVPSVIAVYPKP
jgi:uncharacterized protein YigE (DUF2233 family)